MTLFDFVLFLHITVVLCAFFLAGALHTAEYQIGGTRTVAELRTVTRPMKLGPLFAPIVLALLGLGMWLVQLSKKTDQVFHLSDPFVVVGMIALAILFLTGPLVMGRHVTALNKAMDEAGEGPIPAGLRELACDPLSWAVGHMNTLLALGVVLNMATKPSAMVCALDAAGAAVLGLVLGTVLARRALGAGVVTAPVTA